MSGVFALVWTCSACNLLESTKIISCALVRLRDNVRLILVRFPIASKVGQYRGGGSGTERGRTVELPKAVQSL